MFSNIGFSQKERACAYRHEINLYVELCLKFAHRLLLGLQFRHFSPLPFIVSAWLGTLPRLCWAASDCTVRVTLPFREVNQRVGSDEDSDPPPTGPQVMDQPFHPSYNLRLNLICYLSINLESGNSATDAKIGKLEFRYRGSV